MLHKKGSKKKRIRPENTTSPGDNLDEFSLHAFSSYHPGIKSVTKLSELSTLLQNIDNDLAPSYQRWL
jgi:hypothetical protein